MRSTIILHDDEIRDLLDGSRTQLRRPVETVAGIGRVTEFGRSDTTGYDWTFRDRRMLWNDLRDADLIARSPFGAPGARLAVREAFAIHSHPQEGQGCGYWIEYKADGATVKGAWNPDPASQWAARADRGWLSAATMPRWACRYALEVGEVRCQRLQDATEDDAMAEAVQPVDMKMHEEQPVWGWEGGYPAPTFSTHRPMVFALAWHWDDRFGKRYPWASNPWTFTATGRLVAL